MYTLISIILNHIIVITTIITMPPPPSPESLDSAQQRTLQLAVLGAEQGGVALTGEKKTVFNGLTVELSQLGLRISNNVLDATKAYTKRVDDPEVVRGVLTDGLCLGEVVTGVFLCSLSTCRARS